MYRKQQPQQAQTPSLNQKKPNRNSQPLPIPDRKNQSNSEFKNKDQQLIQLIKEYLSVNGYQRSHDTFKNQKPNLKAKVNISNSSRNQPDVNSLLRMFDKGSREEFLKNTNKYWNTSEDARRLQFDINIYFCIYHVHPNLNRNIHKDTKLDHNSANAFKKYLQTRASDMELDKQQLQLFAMPHMLQPQDNPAYSHLFTKEFIENTRKRICQFLKNHTRSSTISQNQNTRKLSTLQQIFYAHNTSSASTSREEFKQNCNHSMEMESLKHQNNELRTIIESYHKKFQQFAESSKQNLYESNQKWFMFSREIFNIAKRGMKEDKMGLLERYQSFFMGNIQDLIEANQISLFDKNSYVNQDVSVNVSKRGIILKKQQSAQGASCQLDLSKIRHLFLQANLPEKKVQILTVLKAMKNRFNKNPNFVKRRQVIIEYSRSDICGINQQNYIVQKKLFFDGGDRIKQFYVKLMQAITTDVTGLQYLKKSTRLVENLVLIFDQQTEQSRCFKPVVGILQRLSFCRVPRLQMINLGIIKTIFKIFRSEQISVFTLQFITAMMMNLSLKKQSKPYFQEHKAALISIILEYMNSQNTQVRDYINGSIYLLLQSKSIQDEARKQKLDCRIKELMQERQDDMCSQQYHYILKRLNGQEEEDVAGEQSDQEDEQQAQMEEGEDYDEEEMGSNGSSDDCIQGEIQIANGEDILLKNYALIGPEAIREHILTRSVLDETSKRLNNMTTSINRSRRMDNIFAPKGNVTALQPELSALLNRKK